MKTVNSNAYNSGSIFLVFKEWDLFLLCYCRLQTGVAFERTRQRSDPSYWSIQCNFEVISRYFGCILDVLLKEILPIHRMWPICLMSLTPPEGDPTETRLWVPWILLGSVRDSDTANTEGSIFCKKWKNRRFEQKILEQFF